MFLIHSVTKRRHSFSSFLNSKYGKTATADAEIRDYMQSAIPVVANSINFSSSTMVGGKQSQAQLGKKGHRPRSYSE
jgi:hypothetical protein